VKIRIGEGALAHRRKLVFVVVVKNCKEGIEWPP